MSGVWSSWLAEESERRVAAGLVRALRPRRCDDTSIDLAGNDYLGLTGDPRVRGAAAEAALRWGPGAGASRLVTGTLDLHTELEQALAGLMGQPAALVCSTGYHANLAVVTALADREAHIISDAHIHASLIDAARLSRAALTVVPHHDLAAVGAALADPAHAGRRTLVLAESIYSVLGDRAPLTALATLCERYGALLIVDEAHGLGVHGSGVVAADGLAGLPHVVVTATLSKALASQGGAVLGDPALIEHLVNRARPFIFDTGLAPAAAAAALAATRIIAERPELPARIRSRTQALAGRLDVVPPAGAVLSVPMPSPAAALTAQANAAAEGIRVGCFRPPSVPDGISRLRITANAGIDDTAWESACTDLERIVKEHR